MPSSSQQVWCRFGAVSVKFLARTESCQSLSIPAPLARVPGRRSQTPWIKSRGKGDAALDLKSTSQAGRCVPIPRHWFTFQCLRLQHQLGRTPGPATCEQSFWRLVGTSQQLETRRSLFLQLFRPSFVFCLCVCLFFFFSSLLSVLEAYPSWWYPWDVRHCNLLYLTVLRPKPADVNEDFALCLHSLYTASSSGLSCSDTNFSVTLLLILSDK